MPIYDIKCTNNECQSVKEVMVKNSDSPLPLCDKCSSEMKRIPSACKGFLSLGSGTTLDGYKVFGSDKR